MINIVVTGKRQCGKSTLIKRVIEKYNFSVGGYVTLPVFNNNVISGYKMVSVPSNGIEKTIIDIKSDGEVIPYPSVFLDFGVNCIENGLNGNYDFLLLDEIGRIEKNVFQFTDKIKYALDSNKNVFAVLKKEDIHFINEIKKRNDIYLWDIDIIDRKKAFLEICNLIENLEV